MRARTLSLLTLLAVSLSGCTAPAATSESTGAAEAGANASTKPAAEGSTSAAGAPEGAATNSTATPTGASADPPTDPSEHAAADAPAERKKPPNDGIPKLEDLDIPETIPTGTSDADAKVIVEVDATVPEGAEIERCGFVKGGKPLASGGRVDVLECAYIDSPEHVTSAHLVIRPTDRTDDMVIHEVASATMVPGEEGSYTLGKLSVSKGKISITAKIKVLTIGNTGDPEGPEDNSVERWTEKSTCALEEGGWFCDSE